MSKLTVTIGIPAYNEAANIGQLLGSVLTQQGNEFILERVIVVSDGSTDTTVQQAKAIVDPRITVVEHADRQGQALRQNEMLSMCTSDILVLLNADIVIKNENFIANMVQPFILDMKVGLVAARISPLPAEGFFEEVINSSVFLKRDTFESIDDGNNILLCNGRARALSKEFAAHLHFIPQPGEDGYSYIKCVEMGYKFVYQKSAEIFYRSPQTLPDHLKQSKRFLRSISGNSRRSQKARTYYKFPWKKLTVNYFKHAFRHPILVLCYSAVFVIARVTSLWYETSSLWDVSLSSKTITK